jgi:arylsulfatase A-like enzyme
VLIMADDLGYETIGANGGTSYKTPNLDRLAAGGMRFSQCYVQPLCTPTRVQLMTGKYNVRNYVNFGEMDPQAVTFGNLFKQAGYATCVAGKWQLGRDPDLPRKRSEAALDAWRPVPLIGEAGPPKHFRILPGADRAWTYLAGDGTFTVDAWGYCLVELLPDSRHDRYRFRASVRHRNSDLPGVVGLYAAHRSFPGGAVPTHLFTGLIYNDIRTPADVAGMRARLVDPRRGAIAGKVMAG